MIFIIKLSFAFLDSFQVLLGIQAFLSFSPRLKYQIDIIYYHTFIDPPYASSGTVQCSSYES